MNGASGFWHLKCVFVVGILYPAGKPGYLISHGSNHVGTGMTIQIPEDGFGSGLFMDVAPFPGTKSDKHVRSQIRCGRYHIRLTICAIQFQYFFGLVTKSSFYNIFKIGKVGSLPLRKNIYTISAEFHPISNGIFACSPLA